MSASLPKDVPHNELSATIPSFPLISGVRLANAIGGYEIFRLASEQEPSYIAGFIRDFDVQQHPAWELLTREYPGASLFVTECSPDSVEINSDREFSTRAQLLIDVPVKYPDGFETEGSLTVPAFVTGRLKDDGTVIVDEFRLGINHPTEDAALGANAAITEPGEQRTPDGRNAGLSADDLKLL